MNFGNIVLQVIMHRSTESDFLFDITLSGWRPWRHFTRKVLPPGERTQYVTVRQIRIYRTFMLVNLLTILFTI